MSFSPPTYQIPLSFCTTHFSAVLVLKWLFALLPLLPPSIFFTPDILSNCCWDSTVIIDSVNYSLVICKQLLLACHQTSKEQCFDIHIPNNLFVVAILRRDIHKDTQGCVFKKCVK